MSEERRKYPLVATGPGPWYVEIIYPDGSLYTVKHWVMGEFVHRDFGTFAEASRMANQWTEISDSWKYRVKFQETMQTR